METPVITQLTEKVKQLSQLNETLCQTNRALANTCEIQANQLANILSKNVEKSVEKPIEKPVEKPIEQPLKKSEEVLPNKDVPKFSKGDIEQMCQCISQIFIRLDEYYTNKLVCIVYLSSDFNNTLYKFVKYLDLKPTDDRSSWAFKHIGTYQGHTFAISIETYLSYIKPYTAYIPQLSYDVTDLYNRISSMKQLPEQYKEFYELTMKVKNVNTIKENNVVLTNPHASPSDKTSNDTQEPATSNEVKENQKKELTDDEKKQIYTFVHTIRIKYDKLVNDFFCLLTIGEYSIPYNKIKTHLGLTQSKDGESWQYKHINQYSGSFFAVSINVFMKDIKPYIKTKPYIDSMDLDILSIFMKKYTL